MAVFGASVRGGGYLAYACWPLPLTAFGGCRDGKN